MAIEITRSVWNIPLPPFQKLVLLAIADHADKDKHTCWPSVALLMRKTGISRRGIQTQLRALEKGGFIKRISRFNQSNLYRLTPRAANAPPRAPGAPPSAGDARLGAHGVHPNHQGTTKEPSEKGRFEGAEKALADLQALKNSL